MLLDAVGVAVVVVVVVVAVVDTVRGMDCYYHDILE